MNLDDRYDWHELDAELAQKIITLKEQQLFPIELAGKKICIAKSTEKLFGILDRCPHAGTPFHLGSCNKKGVIVCPTHHYKFHLQTGLSADGNHYKLPTFPIVVDGIGVKIGIRKTG